MMRKWSVTAVVALAITVVHETCAFTPPRVDSSTRWAEAVIISKEVKTNTCSAVSSRRIRTVVNAATQDDAAIAAASDSPMEVNQKKDLRRWAGVQRSIARGAASYAAVTLGTAAVAGLSAEVQQRSGGAVALPMAMQSARASVFKPFSKRSVEEKLGNLPAFMITNKNGSPYLTPTGEQGHQLAVFFTNLDDAKEMLREMVQSDAYAVDARILVVSMEKAYGMVRAGPRPTGYTNDNGQEETMDFKLEQDMRSVPKAQKLGFDIDPAAVEEVDIPVFYAEGLEIQRDRSVVRPLFMDPADLAKAWKKLSAENPDVPEKPTVKVFSFPEVIVAMETSDDVKDFGFFASTESADYIRQGRKQSVGFPKPRLGRMWAF